MWYQVKALLPAQSVTLTSGTTSQVFNVPSGVKRIRVKGRVLCSGAEDITVRPNGLTTNQTGAAFILYNGGASSIAGAATLLRAADANDAATIQTDFEFTLDVTTGARRAFRSNSLSFDTAATPDQLQRFNSFGGYWDDTSTVITSVTVNASISMLTGSTFDVFYES